MKKIIAVLLSALVVFVGTLFITDRYVMNKAVRATDNINDYVADELANDFNGDTQLTEEAVSSFLSGNFFCKLDTATGEKHFAIHNNNVVGFPRWVQQNLQDFLEINPYFRNAIFLIDERACRRYRNYGFKSQSIYGGEIIDGQEKAAFRYDFMHSKSYDAVKTSLKSQWRLPSQCSPMKGKIISYYVPICCEDGSFFGVFVLNLDISIIRNKIILHLPYGTANSEMIITDSNGNVIASCPQKYETFQSIDSLRKSFAVEYSVYKRTLQGTKWVIYTFCNPKEIYREATYIRWVMVVISVIGFLLVLICFFIIYRQIYRNLQAKARAEEEIEVAAKVQMSMMKNKHFESPDGAILDNVLRPAKRAGGDLYDYIQIGRKLIFCIGDVSGKGLSAALFMTQVVSLFRNAVNKTQHPSEIIREINDVLAENNPDMTFCTFFCGVLEGNTLTYCNAGHNAPVLLPDNRYLKVKPNIAVGLIGGFNYIQETIDMNDRSLFLYTDGVTEAKNKHRECFDENRLLSALQGDDGSGAIGKALRAVSDFVNGYEQSDDITIVILQVRQTH